MTTNTTTNHATERLLRIMALGDSISASTAAEILGEGEDRARHFVREVAERKMASWSHSPSEGAPARYIDHYNGTERDLPPVTADTTPDSVLLDCKDVLWLLCVEDVAMQTKVLLPPKELVQARFDALLAGDYTPQTKLPAPAPKRESWWDAEKDYLAEIVRTHQFTGARELTRYLHRIADGNSRFRSGKTGDELYVASVGVTLKDTTFKNWMGKIKALALGNGRD